MPLTRSRIGCTCGLQAQSTPAAAPVKQSYRIAVPFSRYSALSFEGCLFMSYACPNCSPDRLYISHTSSRNRLIWPVCGHPPLNDVWLVRWLLLGMARLRCKLRRAACLVTERILSISAAATAEHADHGHISGTCSGLQHQCRIQCHLLRVRMRHVPAQSSEVVGAQTEIQETQTSQALYQA